VVLGTLLAAAWSAEGQLITAEKVLREGDDVLLEVGLLCPEETGPTRFSFRAVDAPDGSSWYPVGAPNSPSGPMLSQRGIITFPAMVSSDRVEAACKAKEESLRELCVVSVRCERADPFAVYETRLEVGVEVDLDCDRQYTTDGIHDPSILVDPGPGSGPPIPPSAGIFTGLSLSDAAPLDEEASLGIRFGFGLSSRSSLELAAGVRRAERPAGDFTGDERPAGEGDIVLVDLLWLRRWGRAQDRFRPFFFAGAGWRFEGGDLDGDAFAPSAGLGAELALNRRLYVDVRILGRWLEDRAEDPWVSEGQIGLSYRFGR
jgi:hypothetical protein